MKGNKSVATVIAALALGAVFAAPLASTAAAEGTGKSAGDFMVRARGIAVIPRDNGSANIIPGHDTLSNEYVPEVDFSYFVTDNVALELIAATTQHDVAWDTGAGVVDLGKVNLLPPTLTLQYHFMPKEKLSPYVGAGLNYTFFYNEDSPAGLNVRYKDHIGYALQAGVDYQLADNWYANLDVKKIFLKTTVDVDPLGVRANVNIDPWIIGIGVGYKF